MSKKDKVNDPWVRIFTVTDPTRHQKGYTVYKVVSKVFPKNSIEAITQVTVWKRYNDFKKLHKALHSMHQSLYLKGSFPPFAKARFFGRFDEEIVEERRKCALELLEFSGKHSPLFTSQVFVKFFESSHDVDFPAEIEVEEEQCLQPVLQPIVATSPNVMSDDSSLSFQQDESDISLGGVWQFHRVEDEVSNCSQTAIDDKDDEDDRTTFTDEDPSSSNPVFDLSEFDPILNKASLQTSRDLCNDWLLSACQSCSMGHDKGEPDYTMSFPKPFENLEDFDLGFKDNEDVVDVSSVKLDLSDIEISGSVSCLDTKEFDPLITESPKLNNSNQEAEFSPAPYILSAAKCVNAAHDAELNENFADAFTFYKTAVDILLHGVKAEKSTQQSEAVKRKILTYLKRAEEVYENHIVQVKKEVVPVTIEDKPHDLCLRRPMSDLSKYRVIGILSRVLLVLNTVTNSTCIVKILRKNPCPQQQGTPNIAPQGINFMVELYEVYETNDAIFLVLEYASGGRLWDHISSYLQRSPLKAADYDFQFPDPESQENIANVYSGKKMHNHEEEIVIPYIDEEAEINCETSLDPDLNVANVYPTSYLTLFKNYLASSKDGNAVSLAKCNVRFSTINDSIDNQHIRPDTYSRNTCSNEIQADDVESSNGKACTLTGCKFENNGSTLICASGNCPVQDVNIHTSDECKNKKPLKPLKDFTEVFSRMDSSATAKPIHLPESCIVQWAAEIVVALSELHKLRIIWQDLMPENILLGSEGHILLTYVSQWNSINHVASETAKRNLYSAPEVNSIFPVSEACDWWSLGAILFELLTGKKLISCYPIGITSHTSLAIEDDISPEAVDLLNKLLIFSDVERLGSGLSGVEDIQCHPFFKSVDWAAMRNKDLLS